MDQTDFLKLIRTQPEDNWRTSYLIDSYGNHCTLGWALDKAGIDNTSLREYSCNIGEASKLATKSFGFTQTEGENIIALNDVANNQAEAIEAIEQYLNGCDFKDVFGELERRNGDRLY